MDKIFNSRKAICDLYPNISPYEQLRIAVDNQHTLYVEQCGNPGGTPVIVLHGGPGSGCSPVMRRFFNPRKYRIILFDQRGCGGSKPTGCVTANTTQLLISDLEEIREKLAIDRWILFGGSWGAALALLYAQNYPDRVTHLVLRGIFLMTPGELEWFYSGAAGAFWPDAWERFCHAIPPEERSDLIGAYHQRLFCGNLDTEINFGKKWFMWESQLSSMERRHLLVDCPGTYARTFARLEAHYFINKGFLDDPDHIFNNMDIISSIPGTIVQGRYDLVCPPRSAYRISQQWPKSDLRIVRAGHVITEREISCELVRVMNALS